MRLSAWLQAQIQQRFALRWRSALTKQNETCSFGLIRAHPDLAGRAALAGSLTRDSTSEQQSAGIDQCSAEELARFHDLNSRYKTKFGFPFVMAVRGRQRSEILAAFERRLAGSPEAEFATALEEIHKIAALRLSELGPVNTMSKSRP